MPDARADALSLLATPQLGTFLTPDQREVVLRALADVEKLREAAAAAEIHAQDWQERAMSAEAQLQAIRAALNGNPGVPAPKEDPHPPAAPPPTVQAAGGSSDEMCKCGHIRGEHAAGETYCNDQLCWCLKFQPRAESPQGAEHGAEAEHRTHRALPEPREPERTAPERAESGDHHGPLRLGNGPVRPEPDRDVLRPEHAVQRDAEARPLELAAEAVAKWGRVRDPGAAWHLWLEDAGEAECGEATDAEIEFLPDGQGMDPETVCLDCRDIEVEQRAEETTASSESPKLAVAGSSPARPAKPRCAGHNKSANVPCRTERVSVQHEGKWFCKRHSPEKRKGAA